MTRAVVSYGNADDASAALEVLRAFGVEAYLVASTVENPFPGASHYVEWEVVATVAAEDEQPRVARAASGTSRPAPELHNVEPDEDTYPSSTIWDDERELRDHG